MNLSNIIDSINQEISNIDTPICIYIAIGSAGHMVKNDKGVDDLYYHQYPKFLEEMHSIKNLTSFHILIDTFLESPPFMTVDNSKGLCFEQFENFHRSTDNKHIVYSLRDSVTTSVYNHDYTDITHELHQLNELAIEENILLVYHDFSGKSVKPLADYFDESISGHLDHIIYGLGNRGAHGCYIDILHPSCKFAFKVEESMPRDIIKVFNMYHLLYNKMNMIEEIDSYPIEHIEIITSSISVILDNTYLDFTNKFSVLRILYQLMIGKAKIEELNKYFLESLCKEINKEMFVSGNYNLCFNEMLMKYANDLNIIIFLKNMTIDKVELMRMIVSDSNEYNWCNTLKNVLSN